MCGGAAGKIENSGQSSVLAKGNVKRALKQRNDKKAPLKYAPSVLRDILKKRGMLIASGWLGYSSIALIELPC